jgi:hypothetical protein
MGDDALIKFNKKPSKGMAIAYLWLLIGMLSMMVTASFAWFRVSSTPRVTDMEMYINSPTGLQISLTNDVSAENWGQNISFEDMISNLSPIMPATWSDLEQCFKVIKYGIDGRQTNKFKAITDATNTGSVNGKQYYVKGTIYALTDSSCIVSLAEAEEINGGENGAGTYVIGTPLWNGISMAHENMGEGSELAIRIGFRVGKADKETGEFAGDTDFFIYEPNADTHYDSTTQYIATGSTDGTDTLVDSDHLILQTTSTWSESSPAQKDVTIKNLGTFISNPELFLINAGEMYRIDLYVWIEGQDIDCYGLSEESSVLASIQFHTDYTGQSGLVDIEESTETVDE